MNDPQSNSGARFRGRRAEAILTDLLAEAGWRVLGRSESAVPGADMVVNRSGASYAIGARAAAESRSDRLIPLWSQAYLQARLAAGDRHAPLAVVAAPRISAR